MSTLQGGPPMCDDRLGELPAEPDCPLCDGTGWYSAPDMGHPDHDWIDYRCPCWERRLILKGPPE